MFGVLCCVCVGRKLTGGELFVLPLWSMFLGFARTTSLHATKVYANSGCSLNRPSFSNIGFNIDHGFIYLLIFSWDILQDDPEVKHLIPMMLTEILMRIALQ